MQPYVIKQGDYLAALAHQFGFDADTVWNDPSNAQLQQLRPNPNILFGGDLLYIPDQIDKPPAAQSLTPGSTNTFVTSAPMVTLSLKLTGQGTANYASRACTIQELDQLTGLTTDGNGLLTFQAPVTLDVATVVFTDTGESWVLTIGHLDPLNTLSGIFQRLQNLGCFGGEIQFDPTNLDLLRTGLWALKASQPGADSAPDSPPASDPLPSPEPAGDANGPSPEPAGDANGSSPEPAEDANGSTDNAGLADDGTLDADTTSLLLKAHGC